MKAYKYSIHGYDGESICYGATASKARYRAYLETSDVGYEISFSDIFLHRAPEQDITIPELPEVNERLDDRDRDVIVHAFGGKVRHKPEQWGYREHYCTDQDDERLNKLVKLGVFSGPHGDPDKSGWVGSFFYLTDDGKTLALALAGQRAMEGAG